MFDKRALLCAGLALAGCSSALPWELRDTLTGDDPLLVGDAVYLLNPGSRTLVEVIPGPQAEGEPYSLLKGSEVRAYDVGEGATALSLSPGGELILTLSHGLEDALVVKRPGPLCEAEGDAGCPIHLPARPLHDSLAFSPGGRYAISYISEQAARSENASVVNLNEIGIYDLDALTATFATIGFAPQAFAFTSDEARMVTLTAAKVVLVDLATGDAVSRELTLGTDTRVSPSQVVITPDDAYALVTVEGSADLYTFDLTQQTLPINIVALSGVPRAMALTQSGDRTLVLTSGGSTLDIVHHDDLAVTSLSLSAPGNRLLVPEEGDYAVVYDSASSGHSLHYIDLAAERARTYLLDNPCSALHVSPGAGALVLFYKPEGGSGDYLDSSFAVAILNLANGDRQPNPVLTSTGPRGAAFDPGASAGEGAVFVTLNEWDRGLVASIDLATYGSQVLVTPPEPRFIGALPADGRMVVVHDAAAGLMSVFDPAQPDDIQLIRGFMAADLF